MANSTVKSNTKQQTEALRALKILSHESRLKILTLLLDDKADPCVGDIARAVGLSQSATSHQLAKLEAWGVIEGQRRGQTICYRPTDTGLTKRVKRIIKALS